MGALLDVEAKTRLSPVIAKILTHLGWSARAPARAFDRFELA